MSSSTTTVNFEKKQCGLTILLYSGMTVSIIRLSETVRRNTPWTYPPWDHPL